MFRMHVSLTGRDITADMLSYEKLTTWSRDVFGPCDRSCYDFREDLWAEHDYDGNNERVFEWLLKASSLIGDRKCELWLADTSSMMQ